MTWLSPYFKPSVYTHWLLCIKLKQCGTVVKVFNSCAKGPRFNFLVESQSLFPSLLAPLSILNMLSIYVQDRKFVGKNVHRGHTNIALTRLRTTYSVMYCKVSDEYLSKYL